MSNLDEELGDVLGNSRLEMQAEAHNQKNDTRTV